MKTLFRQHVFAFRVSLRHFFSPRSGFFLNVLVVAIALSLPFAGLTVLENVRPISEQLSVEPEISIFFSLETPRESVKAAEPQIMQILQETHSYGKLEFVSRENALTKLQDKSGMSDAVSALGGNPLPDAYVLRLAGFDNLAEAHRIDTIASQLQALPGVDLVQVDSAWVKRLSALLHLMRLSLLFLAATLGVVVIAVVFNTIRLQVMSQREEIEVSRLVGATDAFIYRPFFYTGALLGLCAGGLALGAVAITLQPLNQAIADFARLYASEFQLTPLGIVPTIAMLIMSAGLGLAGSLLSVQRHLARLR
jgi:cell division transport system permease protein